MTGFYKNIGFTAAALVAILVTASFLFPNFDRTVALATLLILAINAIVAIAPAYIFFKDPLNAFLGLMVVRLFLLGGIFLLFAINASEVQRGTAIIAGGFSFFAFLGVEIHFLLQQKPASPQARLHDA